MGDGGGDDGGSAVVGGGEKYQLLRKPQLFKKISTLEKSINS